MTNDPKLLNQFRVTEEDLYSEPSTKEAYDDYMAKRREFGDALRAFHESTKMLHCVLDRPLRTAKLVPDGKDWTLKEHDTDDGLMIYIWSEPKQRGRRRPEVPTQRLSFSTKGFRAT